jgi:DNA adenine methylase
MSEIARLKAPFPYFGGKSVVAADVWAALGQPAHYIEPFFGSGAVLLNRPDWTPDMTETINDKDGQVANVWRALQAAPDEVAKVCDWPVNHADLIARKAVLNKRNSELLESLCRDDKFYDVELAGYWIWAASCWIGSGLISPSQKIPLICNGGVGVHAKGQKPHTSNGGKGVTDPYNTNLYEWFRSLSERLRYVRVVCGDWARVCGGNWQDKIGVCGMFFDPPYSAPERDANLYAEESMTVAKDVNAWVLNRGANPKYRIVLAGYQGEHDNLADADWTSKTWSAQGGYGNRGGKGNRHLEILWFSPHCLAVSNSQGDLFE